MVTLRSAPTTAAPTSCFEEQGQYAVWWKGIGREHFDMREGLGTALVLGTPIASRPSPGPPCPYYSLKLQASPEEAFWRTEGSPFANLLSESRFADLVPGKRVDPMSHGILAIGGRGIAHMISTVENLQVLCVEHLREKEMFALIAVETADSGLALAEEFGVSPALFRRVRAIVSETIRSEQGLSLKVERLVDPEIGRPVQLVFEVRGSASASEVTQVWERINSQIESLAQTLDESDVRSLVDYIGVHVHRA